MNILVCIKQVPDTELQILPNEDGSDIKRDGIKYVVNPYDEYAIEEALKTKEKLKEGTVTVVSVGPERAKDAIRTALAMGCDEGILILQEEDIVDPLNAAKILAGFIKEKGFDLILFGKQAIDDDSGIVGPAIAGILGMPQATNVVKLEISQDKITAKCTRQIENGNAVVECKLPVVVTAQKGLNEPRYVSLPGIMKAKKKEIPVVNTGELGLDALTPNIKILKFQRPPERKSEHKIFSGELPEVVEQTVNVLKEEVKVI